MYNINQIDYNEICDDVDFFITASGYESRTKLQAASILKKCDSCFVLGFKEFVDNPVRIENDKFFRENNINYKIINNNDDLNLIIKEIFNQISDRVEKSELVVKLYIDYSCMPKNWYSAILLYAYYFEFSRKVVLYFGYSHSTYFFHDESDSFNEHVHPIEGFSNLTLPVYSNSLILTLGNNKSQVLGLKDYFDIDPYLIYSDTSYNPDYSKEIEAKQISILNATNEEKIFKLPIHNLNFTYNVLFSLASALVNESRIVFAPCGPKPFTLINLIISINLKYNVDVWRISQGNNLIPKDRIAEGLITVVELSVTE